MAGAGSFFSKLWGNDDSRPPKAAPNITSELFGVEDSSPLLEVSGHSDGSLFTAVRAIRLLPRGNTSSFKRVLTSLGVGGGGGGCIMPTV